MEKIIKIESVDLDLALSNDEIIQEAESIFETANIYRREKYAAEPVTIISLFSAITAQDVVNGLVGNSIWAGLVYGAVKVKQFLNSPKVQVVNKKILANHSLPAEGILWDIHYDPNKELTKYMQGLVINSVDITDLPEDTFRVSINLVVGYAKAFDKQRQFICDLPFDNDFLK